MALLSLVDELPRGKTMRVAGRWPVCVRKRIWRRKGKVAGMAFIQKNTVAEALCLGGVLVFGIVLNDSSGTRKNHGKNKGVFQVLIAQKPGF